MKKNVIVPVVAVIVEVTAIVVMMGWILGIAILTSGIPNAPTMKFTTAVCFFCSAFILTLVGWALEGRHNFALTFLTAPCLVIALLMSSMVLSSALGIQTGVENFFVQEDTKALLTVYPGRPSIGTIVNFILILCSGLVVMLNPCSVRLQVKTYGSLVLIIGAIGLFGYVLRIPALYFAFDGISTAMAVHTAVLFVLLGLAFVILAKDKS